MIRLAVVLVAVVAAACDEPKRSVAELQDPTTCMECHPGHYQEWSGSMHAYAAEDPVFVAMNARGQRETNGELGDFCVKCHAPMALLLGEASGSNFDPAALSPAAKGVTCYFCHNVEAITEDHNNGLVIAMDQTMRGGLRNPSESSAHDSKYDEAMASRTNNSRMCGSCHDVVTPGGVHLERTFAEWKDTVFAINDPATFLPLTCTGCHMFSKTGVVAEGAGSRQFGVHEHGFPGIDQALTPFPEMEAQAALIKRDLDAALKLVGLRPLGSREPYGGICVQPNGEITVRIDTFNVGHMFPSGAAQDRRAWIETIAYDASNNVLFSSGVVPDGVDPEDTNDPYVNCTGAADQCSGFWDRTAKADGTPAHFFWEVATVDSKLLKAQTTLDQNAPDFDHSATVRYVVGPTVTNNVDRIESRLQMRALPYELLDLLIESGDLDPSIRGQLKTLSSAGAKSTWTRATAGTGLAENTGCNPF
jgi:Cytochrome c554 and c-prime